MINPNDFEIIDIENRDENFTDIELNEILHDHTKTVTNNDELTRQLIDFCKYISYVKDETLLNGAIKYVKKNVPINLNNFDADFKQITVTGNFSDNDLIKIKAIYFSLIVRYEIMVIKENPPQMEPPIFDFYIDVDNKLVYYNLRFVLNQIRNNYDVGFVEYTHKKPLNEAMPYYIDYITELQNSHHRRLEVNTERILFITNAKNNYLERQQYLKNQPQPPTPPEDKQSEASKEKEFLSNQITHLKKVEIAKAIKDKYSSYKGKDFKILYEALLKLDLFPKKGKRQVFYRCLQNEGYNINSHQMLEDIHFTTGANKKGGDYEESDDEKRRDTIINHLETIINTK